MTTETPTAPTVDEELQEEAFDLETACERVEKRFDHVDDDEFMNLLKKWILEILHEKERTDA